MLWRLDQAVRDTTARRQLEAVSTLSGFRDGTAPAEKLVRGIVVGGALAPPMAEQAPVWARQVQG